MKDEFLDYRIKQEQDHISVVGDSDDAFHSLITVEMNITELCNRLCAFCPRVDPEVYPNRNLHMSEDIVYAVARGLSLNNSDARISFSGFGEPLLCKDFVKIVRTFRMWLPDNTIECNTNGDKLTRERAQELFDAGLSHLYINMYDGPEQCDHFTQMMNVFPSSQWQLRPHWDEEDYGLNLNNRSGMVALDNVESGLSQPCYYPFYKMLIDYNGDVLFCSNDWGREIIVGNVLRTPLRDIWLGEEMTKVRRRLGAGDRSQPPCSTCSVHGMLHGKSSFDRLVKEDSYASR